MRLWRSSDHADLNGAGGLRLSGRWHSRGRRIVYLSDHPASALLEILVHLEVDPEDLPSSYQLLAVDVPDDVSVATIDANELAPDWRQNQPLTRAAGDRWLAENRTALLKVPSSTVPAAANWLLNPGHPGSARVRIAEIMRMPFDARLFKRA